MFHKDEYECSVCGFSADKPCTRSGTRAGPMYHSPGTSGGSSGRVTRRSTRIVNMGVRNPDGSICYVIGVLKAIRVKPGKHDGDTLHVVIEPERTGEQTQEHDLVWE